MTKVPILKLILALWWCGVILAACNLHLRQPLILPQTLHNIYILNNTNNQYLSAELTHQMQHAGINVVNSSKQANFVLTIKNCEITNQLLIIDSFQQTRQYLISCTTTFSLSDQHGHFIIPQRVITESIPLTLESNQILAASNTAEQLTNAILNRLAYKIFLVVTTVIPQYIASGALNAHSK